MVKKDPSAKRRERRALVGHTRIPFWTGRVDAEDPGAILRVLLEPAMQHLPVSERWAILAMRASPRATNLGTLPPSDPGEMSDDMTLAITTTSLEFMERLVSLGIDHPLLTVETQFERACRAWLEDNPPSWSLSAFEGMHQRWVEAGRPIDFYGFINGVLDEHEPMLRRLPHRPNHRSRWLFSSALAFRERATRLKDGDIPS